MSTFLGWPIVSMPHAQAQAWIAWLMGTRGIKGVFSFGDPLAQAPQGTGAGSIAVSGGGQTGYSLLVTGGTGGGCLLPGDWMQIGLRLYRNLSVYNGGSQTLSIFPQVRESPLDKTAVAVLNTTGMFRLKANKRSWSVTTARVYGIQFDIEEAL
ncbi:MAG: hypothetical protein M3Y27_30195 [Acidobacteriota bacterium]|nr:hypothetical protein [Acidobacteriota bacterium]